MMLEVDGNFLKNLNPSIRSHGKSRARSKRIDAQWRRSAYFVRNSFGFRDRASCGAI